MTLTIGRGRGYVPAELNRGPETTIGVIPIDSIFSPVRRVAYDVEAARVGQRTDYDKLVLDVTTDGSIEPRDAIGAGCRDPDPPARDLHRPRQHRGLQPRAADRGRGARRRRSHGMENFPIEELELGVRSYNCLKRVGIETIGDLTSKSETELAAIPNFGRKSIEEVARRLAAHGLTLKGEELVVAMRHARSGKKLGRDSAHRKALYSNLAGALIQHGRIQTTEAKAKAVKPYAEKMITLGKRGDLHARRLRRSPSSARTTSCTSCSLNVAPRFAGARTAATPASSSSARGRGDAAPMVLPRARRLRPRRCRLATTTTMRGTSTCGRAPRCTPRPITVSVQMARFRDITNACPGGYIDLTRRGVLSGTPGVGGQWPVRRVLLRRNYAHFSQILVSNGQFSTRAT